MKQGRKNPYEKGVAIHSAPSFALGTARCTAKRKQGNRWAGYGAPKRCNQGADAVVMCGRQHEQGRYCESLAQSCVVEDPRARLETSYTRTGRPRRRLRQNQVGRTAGEGLGHKTCMHVIEESDSGIVPMSHSNKDGKPYAESEEGRPLIEENTHRPHTPPTQSGTSMSPGLASVRKASTALRRHDPR